MSTPVSDGSSVFVAYGQGQVAAYDLAGNCRWGVRFHEWEHGKRGMCNLSPVLCAGVLLVKSPNNLTFRGLDPATGRILWERKGDKSYDYRTATAVTLNGPDGRVVHAIIYPNTHEIRDPKNDRLLGQLPNEQRHHLIAMGDRVWIFGYPKGSTLFRLRAEADGTVSCHPLGRHSDLPEKNGWPIPNCARGVMIYPSGSGCDLFSWATAERVGQIKAKNGGTDGRGYMGIGPYVFGVLDSNKGDNCWWRGPMSYGGGQGGQGRPTDRKAMVRYGVWEVSDPKAPKLMCDRNLLQEPGPASDIYVERFFAGLDPFLFAGCYHGSASFFGLMMGTPAASGNRLFIQSPVHLCCIGDPKVPYDWNPASRPQHITKGLAQP
jgi:hypothetical protein